MRGCGLFIECPLANGVPRVALHLPERPLAPGPSWLCLRPARICLCPPGSPLLFGGSFRSFQLIPAGVLGEGTSDTDRVKGWDIGTVGCRL